MRSIEKCRATESRHVAESGRREVIPEASSSRSRQIQPLMPLWTISSTAPPAKARTGVPHAIASIITRPNGSSH